ncbi:hypothetical protein HK101_006020, partial [Irineochytrium annulatum]
KPVAVQQKPAQAQQKQASSRPVSAKAGNKPQPQQFKAKFLARQRNIVRKVAPRARPARRQESAEDRKITKADIATFCNNLFKDSTPAPVANKQQQMKQQQPKQQAVARPSSAKKSSAGTRGKVAIQGAHLISTPRNALVLYRPLRAQIALWSARQYAAGRKMQQMKGGKQQQMKGGKQQAQRPQPMQQQRANSATSDVWMQYYEPRPLSFGHSGVKGGKPQQQQTVKPVASPIKQQAPSSPVKQQQPTQKVPQQQQNKGQQQKGGKRA